jgi:competence protein ComEA
MKKMNLLVALLLALTITFPATLSFAATKPAKESAVTLTDKVNINTATIEDLTEIPGIGPKTAQSILSYRDENGKFATIDDLINVKGIGEKSLEKLKPYITI